MDILNEIIDKVIDATRQEGRYTENELQRLSAIMKGPKEDMSDKLIELISEVTARNMEENKNVIEAFPKDE